MKKGIFTFVLLFTVSVLFAQHQISGTVNDSNGEPIIGATVVEKGTINGTVTNLEGEFSLNVSSPDATLVVSYVGYQKAELQVQGRDNVMLSLTEGIDIGEIQVVGSRSYKRSSTDSPVAIDVLDVSEIANSSGKVEINQILQYAAPSFNATKQSGSDGADHIDPASLRGLGPDQTLVLVNGKRRHQSSLINVFGTRGRGNSGTDLNAIPASAIKRIEVLRDGASAQYGSDAIAGVINIVLKNNEGLTGGVTYGAHSTAYGEGFEDDAGDVLFNLDGTQRLDGEEKSFDGNALKVDLNYGTALGQNGGYINLTGEFLDKDRTLRPGWSWRQGYGSAAVEGLSFMVNSTVPASDNTDVYIFGGLNLRDTDAYAFSRGSFADGDNRAVPSLYPDGFTPRITSEIDDGSGSIGVRHNLNNGWSGDLNNTYGKNNFHYTIKGTNNASLWDASPTEFDAGGHSLAQNTTSLDLSKYFDNVASGLNLAFGAEYRFENFEIFAGEEASYALYDVNGVAITDPANQIVNMDPNGDDLPGGSQGFPGYSPDNEVDETRNNIGVYADAEINPSEAFLIGGAVRFENYSDFGETINGKLSARYKVSDDFALRGSFSSGFRAPSLAQIHYNLIFNNIVAGESVPSLLSSNTSDVTRAFGIESLQEETALNGSVGFTFAKNGFSATVDGYIINVDDRIVLTDNFTDQSILGPFNVDAAQFFANGVDTKTQGVDVVLNYTHDMGANALKFGLAGNFNDLTIEEIHNGDLNQFTFFGPFSQAYLEAAAPDYKIGFNLGFESPKFDGLVSLTQFSEVIIQDFQWVDTPATTQQEADDLLAVATDTYDAAMTVDLSLSYKLNSNLKLTVGGNNITNRYPTEQFDGWTDQGGFADSVQMGSDGAYFFGRIGFGF